MARVLIFVRQAWQATVDGVPQRVAYTPFGVTVGGTTYYTYGWIPVASNLSQGEHEIILSSVTPPQNFGDLPPYLFPALTDIQLTDGKTGTGSVLSNTYTPRKVLMAIGHSIVAGRWLQDATKSYVHLLAQPQNMAIANRGVSGCTFLNYSGQGITEPLYTAQSVEARTNEVTDLKPDVLIVDAFVNDLQRRNAPGMRLLYYNRDPQKPTLESRLKTFLLSVLAANPSTRIFVLGVQNTTVAPVADISELNTRLSAVITNLNSPNCHYIAPYSGFNPAAHTKDGLHPNAAGSQVLAEYLRGFLFGKQ
jgi:lysophospholipase L1-like esterase